ncbi:MAG: cytidylate kinase-like family protein [Candidatus Cloacimonadaceae bacterium]|jgi:cytidylate kinase|nr:cytidylate kinase-like family protein [Candidatus Cloacimonadota bacterium]MDY0128175.1 cytidylate kinase-like family protein [Candidatus Cloacimonadaceae bacterium]MCB5255481.1 cytidylate kinase-like family protein [Candidatus Cloacimonadota bacterium]MCK9179040.1 cytidylate kinase-like family protein [Candidatus Cloacimonadota bacterium]MCK9243259.1 cytidylate kinase-like family protein [Candidatus Cloacimonadota bacterium]
MNIITISREFGSGGREVGINLSRHLAYDYYDKEIIAEIAKNKDMEESFVERTLENQGWHNIPLTHHCSLSYFLQSLSIEVLLEQRRVIEEIAKVGRDFIIVGRNADTILQEHKPFNIFLCADMESKINRCRRRAPEGEDLTDKELIRKIHKVDKNRARTRDLISGSAWKDPEAYHLTVNTASWEIQEITVALADFAKAWFERPYR